MKSLIVFYSVCILMFYSLIVYIGHRHKNSENIQSTGLLEEVTVPSTDYKISKARLLAQSFDNAIVYTKMNEPAMASEEIYNSIMLLANNGNTDETYSLETMNKLLKDLSICYITLEQKKNVSININKVFESSELFIAYGYIHQSKKELKHNNILKALENITKAQECLALSAKYAKENDLATHVKLLENTKQLINEITSQSS